MQDEVTKHVRKIRQEMNNREHSFWKKTKEIVIEILIIVFAVTLSIWLHNWSDHRAEEKAAVAFLRGLRKDILNDIDLMEINRKGFAEEKDKFQYLLNLSENKTIDTVDERRIAGHFNYEQGITHANVARYEGFKSSGKIGTIEDDSLRQAILAYYQQTVPDVNDVEAIVNNLQSKLMELQFAGLDKMSVRDFAKSRQARAYLSINVENLENSDGDGAIQEYVKAEARAKHVIELIDAFLKRED